LSKPPAGGDGAQTENEAGRTEPDRRDEQHCYQPWRRLEAELPGQREVPGQRRLRCARPKQPGDDDK
jgi:hypothetical protein